MTPFRWALLLVAVLAGAAGLRQLLHEPGEVPRAKPAMASNPLGLNLPGFLQPDASTPSPPPKVTAAPRPVAGALAPATSAPAGAEDYGPLLERAQAGQDAALAWEAVGLLRQCASNEARRASFEKARDQGAPPDVMTQLMLEADADARRCQTVTAQHEALLPELAVRALRAGLPQAASAFTGPTFPGELTAAQRQAVADAMRREARTGDALALLGAASSHEAWGLADAERLGFVLAFLALPAQPGADAAVRAAMETRARVLQARLPLQQQAAAQLAGQQIAAPAQAQAPGGRR